MKVRVFNGHSSAVEIAGIVFRPRRELELDLTEREIEKIRASRFLVLSHDDAVQTDEVDEIGTLDELNEAQAEIDAIAEETAQTLAEGFHADEPLEGCDFPDCGYTGTPAQLRGHKLSHRGDETGP